MRSAASQTAGGADVRCSEQAVGSVSVSLAPLLTFTRLTACVIPGGHHCCIVSIVKRTEPSLVSATMPLPRINAIMLIADRAASMITHRIHLPRPHADHPPSRLRASPQTNGAWAIDYSAWSIRFGAKCATSERPFLFRDIPLRPAALGLYEAVCHVSQQRYLRDMVRASVRAS